jgi:hypothetical protein
VLQKLPTEIFFFTAMEVHFITWPLVYLTYNWTLHFSCFIVWNLANTLNHLHLQCTRVHTRTHTMLCVSMILMSASLQSPWKYHCNSEFFCMMWKLNT